MFIEKFKRIKEFILDLIFPRECLGCGKANTYICHQCLAKIELNKKFYCALCKRESQLGRICPACQPKTALKAIWLATDYNDEILQELIHNFKYKYIEDLSSVLASKMIEYLQANRILENFNINAKDTVFVPVPLHKKRILQRGFNQSSLLARQIGDFYHAVTRDLLSRKKNTLSQVNLNKNERQENLKEAFILNNFEKLEHNKKIILIDDVVTTGSTLTECAKILQSAGFNEIYALVIAQRED